ncbi:HAD family hydrolase [Magnetococcales bacterium HHB-1]
MVSQIKNSTATDTEKMLVAVFDINGTLIKSNIGVRFVSFLFKNRKLSLYAILLIALLYPLIKLRLLDFRFAICLGLWSTVGLSPKESQALGAECFDRWMKPHILADGLKEIQSIREQGGSIILATGSHIDIARPFGQFVGADAIIAAKPKQQEEIYTSEYYNPLPYREGKRDLVKHYIEKHFKDAHVLVYSDTFRDQPLLTLADHPIAINAPPALQKTVRQWGGDVKFFS